MTDQKLNTEPKYLSDAIPLDQFRKGCLNLVDTPCGSGKTVFALNKLPALAQAKDRFIYLIDTDTGVENILQYPDTKEFTEFPEGFPTEPIPTPKITVMNYHKIGGLAKRRSSIIKKYDLFVCDELDRIYKYVGMEQGKISRNNPNMTEDEKKRLLAESPICAGLSTLENLCCYGDCYVVAMTATPRLVLERFGADINRIVPDCEVISYRTDQRHNYSNLEHELSNLQKGKKYIVYLVQIKQIEKYCSFAKNLGFRAVGLWSPNRQDYPMDEEQYRVCEHILKKHCLPDDLDILFINESYERSINIKGKIDAIYVHYNNEETITQVRGRYRGDLRHLFVYNKSAENEKNKIELPQEYLNRPLFQEDKETLACALNIVNENGRLCKFPTISKQLIQQGYTITEGRKNNKRYSIIYDTDEDE